MAFPIHNVPFKPQSDPKILNKMSISSLIGVYCLLFNSDNFEDNPTCYIDRTQDIIHGLWIYYVAFYYFTCFIVVQDHQHTKCNCIINHKKENHNLGEIKHSFV